ncbi:MAG: hypothetical protein RIF33_03950 [Cyclobacteriaceae bacterium]
MKHAVGDAIMRAKITLLLLVLSLLGTIAQGQGDIPIGTWRTHFSYSDVHRVTYLDGERKIYAATANGLFYIDEEDNSINKLTKVDGLSDAGISSLKSDAAGRTLAIGYQSGIIDFLEGNELSAFTDLAVASQLEDRTIYDIEFSNDRIYIATSIGVVVLSSEAKEIIESYVEIGPAAATQPIADIVISTDSIYLATPIGLLVASLNPALNLQDFNNWNLKLPESGNPRLRQIQWLGSELLASTGQVLYSYRNGVWIDRTSELSGEPYESVRLSRTQPLIIARKPNASSVFNDQLTQVSTSSQVINDVANSSSGLFLGSSGASLLHLTQGAEESLVPSGPHTDNFKELSFQGGQVYGIAEYRDFLRQPLGDPGTYSVFNGSEWSIELISGITDLSSVSFNGQLAWGAYGQGVYNESQDELIDELTPGSPFIPPPNSDFGPLISDVHYDDDEQLWVANYNASPSVHVFDESGNWRSISLGAASSARFPEQLTTSPLTGALWARIDTDRGGGIYTYDPAQQSVRYVTASANDMPSSQVNDLAIDKNDEVWVATRGGVAFFQSSLSPFIPDFADAIVPIFNGELLLKDEFISTVAVDGGNRKWFGTNIGLWLFSENGDELVHHFTRANSPLPSDSITNIAINPFNGEVFISTTKGLVSFRSDATDASTIFSTVKVFPNPVTPDYQGLIGFSGLASDVNVKITDISGRLVREFFANGGSASWDGLDVYGERVSTGVYLVFCSDVLGEETFVGKFAVVR